MEQTVVLPIIHRLSMILEMLCQAIAYRTGTHTARGFGPFPLVPATLRALVWQRVRRAEARFRAYVARFYAGRIRPYAPRAKPATPAVLSPGRKPSTPPQGPRRPGWLFALLQHEAGAAASQLRHLLSDPEMQNLLAASPQAARILRPICRMLAIEPELLSPPAPPPELIGAPPPPRVEPAGQPNQPGVLPPMNQRVVWHPQNDP